MVNTSTDAIRVLHVDDDPEFLDLAKSLLERESDRFDVETVANGEECLNTFDEAQFDCIVSDYEMPGMDGLELLESIRSEHSRFPFILFTGKGSEEIASRAIGAGVSDYLQKGGPEVYHVLANRISNAVEQYRSRRELVRFKLAVEHAGHAIYMTDSAGMITYVNPAFEEVTGYSKSEAVGKTPKILNSGMQDTEYFERLWETISTGDVWSEKIVNRRRNGELYTAIQMIAPIEIQHDGIDGYVAVQQAVSDYQGQTP